MFYTPLYILFSNINVDVSLDNLALFSPVVSSMYLNIIMIASVGIIGYIILQSIHLNKQPPLITVFSISAMHRCYFNDFNFILSKLRCYY
ncbi:DUF6688 domain-containing protein [Thomasclavelia ramosa]|uniref:DUF6688 domain-containing protein n=1 Tax=Thomasclavelia TaxID=3025755 RepID=UPI003AB07D71